MSKFKNLVVFIKILIDLVLNRTFGNIIHDFALKYNEKLSKCEFRKLNKLYTKVDKAEQDIHFLQNCQNFGVFPKFITFNLPNVNFHDAKFIRKRLLKSAIHKRKKEKYQSLKEKTELQNDIKAFLSPVDWYILQK